MSLARTDFKRLAAAVAPFALAFGLAANDAKAEIPAVGQCGPAEAVKAEISKAGLFPIVAFDRFMLTQLGEKVFRRNSIVASSDFSAGFYFSRNDKDQLCNDGQLANVILADNRVRKVDPRTLSKAPQANASNGINVIINSSAKKFGEFPMVQALITNSDGQTGIVTLLSNPDTRKGGLIFSDLAGSGIRATMLEAGEKDGQKFGVQYTPVALSILDGKNKTASARHPTAAGDSLSPRY